MGARQRIDDLWADCQEARGRNRSFPNWTNNTGAVLYAFAEHYFYTRDREWLSGVAPALIKACNWIINERQQTKERDAQGQKVLQYGLMPPGQPYDTDASQKGDYYVCCTDGFTYQGLARIAEALADMGHPEGPRLRKEADSYREDILEVLRRTRQTNPELPPYPERLYGPEGWGSFVTGAIVLVDAGLIDPRDPAFESIESYTKKNFNLNVLGLWGRCHADDKRLRAATIWSRRRTFITMGLLCAAISKRHCSPFIRLWLLEWTKKRLGQLSASRYMTGATRHSSLIVPVRCGSVG